MDIQTFSNNEICLFISRTMVFDSLRDRCEWPGKKDKRAVDEKLGRNKGGSAGNEILQAANFGTTEGEQTLFTGHSSALLTREQKHFTLKSASTGAPSLSFYCPSSSRYNRVLSFQIAPKRAKLWCCDRLVGTCTAPAVIGATLAASLGTWSLLYTRTYNNTQTSVVNHSFYLTNKSLMNCKYHTQRLYTQRLLFTAILGERGRSGHRAIAGQKARRQ